MLLNLLKGGNIHRNSDAVNESIEKFFSRVLKHT